MEHESVKEVIVLLSQVPVTVSFRSSVVEVLVEGAVLEESVLPVRLPLVGVQAAESRINDATPAADFHLNFTVLNFSMFPASDLD